MFGKKKRGSVKSPRFTAASGKILREIIKQLRANKYVSKKYVMKDGESHSVGLHLSPLGITELDKVAAKIVRSQK